MDQNPNHYIPLHKRIQAGQLMTQRFQLGITVAEISRQLDISRTHLYELERKYLDDPSMVDQHRVGRPLKVTSPIRRRIVRAASNNPFRTSTEIAREVNIGIERESQVCSRTVRGHLVMNGLRARRPCRKPKLTANQVRLRRDFATEYKDKDLRFWRNVLFCDETALRLRPDNRRLMVRRRPGERYNDNNLVPTYSHGGGNIMFWGCISLYGQGELFRVTETLTGQRYAEVLRRTIPPTLRTLNIRSPYLYQDHAPCHGTQAVQDTIRNLGLRTLQNPPNSPDLNPIETLWSYWKVKVAARYPQNLAQLERFALEEWRAIPLRIIEGYISSMPRRLAEVYNNQGRHTRY